jgi:hypothetical protein
MGRVVEGRTRTLEARWTVKSDSSEVAAEREGMRLGTIEPTSAG